MKKLLTFLMMSILTIGVGWAEEVTDVLTRATTGVTGNNYSDWSGKTSNSDAVYAGNSAGGNESIQLRSNNNNSGIVTTASGGKVKSITIAFNSETADGRTVNIYGKNSAYSTSADLYASSSQGTLLGTIVKGTSTSLTVDGDYAFIGLRSASSALYISSITIIWETSGGTTLEKVETPTFSVPAGSYDEAQIVEISCATTGATIYFSTDNETFKNYNEAITISETTTLHAYASKEGMDNSQTASATYIIVDNSPAQPGEEVMFDYRTGKEFAQSNGDDMEQSSKKGITIDFGGGSNTSNTPKWYSSNNGNARVYVNNTITVNAGELAIESVSFTFEGTNSLSNPSVQPGSYDNGVWSVGATSGVLTADKTARIATITVKLAEEGTVVNPPTISGSEIFEGSTEITITAQDGATIYYTVDGSEPTTSSTLYSAPFTINATTTVKAIAYVGEVASSIATKTFVKYDISSVAEFNALEQGTNFKYTGNNLVAIAQTSNGANLYVQDGEKGMLIYKSGGIGKTYVLGDKIPSGFTGTRSTYNGAPEMTNPAGFADSEDNVEVSPLEITPSQVGDNFGRYTIIKNATFNTSAKTITANGETIDYYTTFLNGSPTDGVAYNVIGVCTYYTKNNAYLPEFLPISFTEVETTGPDYYLIGSFNDWAQKDENYKFTALANGSYSFNGTIPDDVLFKVLKVDGENITWLGGSAGDYFGITKDVCTDIPLVDGANFKMEVGGICTFTVSSDQKLSVSKESQLFLVGTMNDWEKTSALEAANDGWTITMPLEIDDEFKFVDEWGTWYGGGNTIAEANLGAQITLNNGGNFVMAVDGNFVFIVATDKSSFKITRKAETTEAMFNFNDDYATLFPFLNGVTLPYDIEDPITATVDGISVTISPKTSGSTANRIYNNDPKLRVYTGTITVTAPEGYNLTGIEFTNHSTNFNLTPSDGDLSGSGETHTWTGATATLVLTVG
ncbi:MAG: chitobiase/beta-hexosaminidase C-terminal domain-containing protein, partial [Muribaculaceae bacterium]|nr:chitobiase/beta-hexosaminidase C-terminal domain-containing protein [Muribaculaceae bacterium]